MDGNEVDEAPEEMGGSSPEPSEPSEPSRPAESLEPAPAEPAPEPEAPKEASEPEPETPPPTDETGSVDDNKVQDLIDAIGDLNQTITEAVTQEPEQQPVEEAGGGAGGSGGGDVQVTETSSVDLGPVVTVLERTNALLEQQIEIDTMQHNDLLQLQANVNFVFLAVAALIGVVLGVAVAKVFRDLWRS